MSQDWRKPYQTAITALQIALQEDGPKFYDKEVNAAGGRLRKTWKVVGDVMRSEKKKILEVRNSRTKK